SEKEKEEVQGADVGVQTEEEEVLLTGVAPSTPIKDEQDTLVQQRWLIERVAIKGTISGTDTDSEVIHTHCALLNMTTQSNGAIHDGLVQSEHPILFKVDVGLEDLGWTIVLHQGISYQWQHSLEHLALKPVACTLAPEDITNEVQKDLLLALRMSGFGGEEEDDSGLSEQS
ncbi:hypothetical protein C0995_004998, partial [Termitomyces sp. Mi166